MIRIVDACSLSEFQSNVETHLQRLKQSGRPKVLTVDGKAEVVVQDAVSYQQMLEQLEGMETIQGIHRGLESMKQSRGKPVREVLNSIADRLGIHEDR